MNKTRIIIISLIVAVLVGIGAYNEFKGTDDSSSFSNNSTSDIEVVSKANSSSEPSCEHEWTEATCITPKTCSKCGKTVGTSLGHDYKGMTCTTDGKCTRCGDIQKTTGHSWLDADCEKPKTCRICEKTEGKALGHTTDVGICERCGKDLFKPISNSGYGDSAISDIKVGSGLYTINLTHNGSSNFIVHLYDESGDKELLVNEIGDYNGTVLLIGESPYILNIKADGEWSYTINKLSTTDDVNFSGRGDFVTPIFYGSTAIYKFTHDGDSNFVVRKYTSSDYDLLINEIGEYNGTQLVEISGGNAFFEIIADGNWTITKQ